MASSRIRAAGGARAEELPDREPGAPRERVDDRLLDRASGGGCVGRGLGHPGRERAPRRHVGAEHELTQPIERVQRRALRLARDGLEGRRLAEPDRPIFELDADDDVVGALGRAARDRERLGQGERDGPDLQATHGAPARGGRAFAGGIAGARHGGDPAGAREPRKLAGPALRASTLSANTLASL